MATSITTSQLQAATAGSDDFIRTKNGIVVGLALRLDLNPNAPEVIIVGRGTRREHRARLVEKYAAPLPTYMKRGVNSWEYIGDFGPYIYRTDKSTIAALALVKSRQPNSVAGGLYLNKAAALDQREFSDEESRIANRGFPDAKTRKEIEEAAIRFACKALDAEGYKVNDHQKLNRGYDLLATRNGKSLLVEVKGTDADFPRFFLSRNERRCSQMQDNWQIRVVCKARTSPKMHVYSAAQVDNIFAFSSMSWECTPK